MRLCHDAWMPGTFKKRPDPAPLGSIFDRLQMLVREVRFYREIGPALGVRVAACFRAVGGARKLNTFGGEK
jgi:hypothetical protein